MDWKIRTIGRDAITFIFIWLAHFSIVWSQSCGGGNNSCGIPGPPEYLQVFNTSFTYINIQWTPPRYFFDSPKSGYIVKIETLGDPNIEVRLIYSSCHSEGINITDLEEYTKYCVYVTTFNEYGKANSSSCIVAVTGEKARVEFTTLNKSSTSMELNWNTDLPEFLSDMDGQRGFKIDYFKAEDNEVHSRLFCNNTSSYVFSNLSVFTNYCFSVVAFSDNEIITKVDNYKCAFTDEEAPRGPPLNITAQNTSSTSLYATWKPIAENLRFGIILGYRINFIKQTEAAFRRKRRSIVSPVSVLVENELSWTLEGLEKFTNYCIQIAGFNSKGGGNLSDWVCALTDEDVPSLPPNITAGFNTSSKSLYINWTAIPPDFIHGNLLGYTISYQVINSEDSQIAITIDTGPSEMSKEIEELSIYTTYCVRVAGRTRIGAGNCSDCFNITTDDEVPSSPPVDVSAISFTSPHTMNVTWRPPSQLNGELTGYKVVFEHRLDNGTWLSRQVMVCSPQVTLTGLDISSRYKIKVAASTRKGFSPYSEIVDGETCSCPENLTIVAGPSSLDDEHRSLSAVIESLVTDVCGECYAFGRTNLIYTTASQGDVDINFPVVLSHDYSSIGSKFVTVIQVPGLALVRRKTEPEEGAYDKVITSSVFSSWPIFAISGLLTLLAGLVIWVLDVSSNPEEFPPVFYKGAGEGFWWAFITMTTLGYGDRTPKSDQAKAFAMIWFLVGLVVFALFSSGLTSDLTVVVANGGPQSAASSNKVQNIATLKDSAEKYVAVRKLMDRFNLSAEYKTLDELVEMLKERKTDAILLDMYALLRRKDLFNGSWFEVAEIVQKELSHGIVLSGASIALATEFKDMIRDRDVQSEFLLHEGEEDEEEHVEEQTEEESGTVFLEPGSPFFSLTLQVCGGALGGLLLCGCVFEACQRSRKNMKQAGRHCQDEDDMKKIVEEFHRDFTGTHNRLKKKARALIKLRQKQSKSGGYVMNPMYDTQGASLW